MSGERKQAMYLSVELFVLFTSEVSDDSTQAMKIVMLAEKNLSWSSTTQCSNLSYQYAATLAITH